MKTRHIYRFPRLAGVRSSKIGLVTQLYSRLRVVPRLARGDFEIDLDNLMKVAALDAESAVWRLICGPAR